MIRYSFFWEKSSVRLGFVSKKASVVQKELGILGVFIPVINAPRY